MAKLFAPVVGLILGGSLGFASSAAPAPQARPAVEAPAMAGDLTQNTLLARKPLRKSPADAFRLTQDSTGRLIVKFADSAKVRLEGSPGAQLARFNSKAGRDVQAIQEVVGRFGLRAKPASKRSEQRLEAIQLRAAAYSGKSQPDLAGIYYVEGPLQSITNAAQALNQLEAVEFVQLEKRLQNFGGDPACGEAGTGDCFVANGSAFCEDEACCTTITTVDPTCGSDEIPSEWDEVCVALANLYCQGGDRCASELNGGCFEPHPTAGCVDEDCCNDICAIDAFCCEVFWDEGCVALALDVCRNDDGAATTPDFEPAQGHLRQATYAAQDGGPPATVSAPAPNFPGYNGHGYHMFSPAEDFTDSNGNGRWDAGEQFVDDNGNGAWDNEGGLWGLSRFLFDEYGVGETQGGDDFEDLIYNTRGRGIKVAVIEWAYYEGHEDLDVITEPGQTLIVHEDITEPDHATACLGIINAKDNGEGVTGLAPEAQAYFFPLTSVEDGPREADAFFSAYEMLDAGDVISCSFGGGGNLNTVQFTWLLIRLGSDLGVTTCVAAGNDCSDLSGFQDFGDSGCIVVGAGQPGTPHARLIFSNYYSDLNADPSENGNMVHVQAWGSNVTTTGYGDLFLPTFDDGTPLRDYGRSYTNSFNGTSSACPQVAGIVACVQGMARQFYGIPLAPEQVRAAVSRGFPQQGVPNPADLPGFDPAEVPCALDNDPDADPRLIGPYTTTAGDFGSAASYVLNQDPGGFTLFDSPWVEDVVVLRGRREQGNRFSIMALDTNNLVVRSSDTNFGNRPGAIGGGTPLFGSIGRASRQVRYLLDGNITDTMLIAQAESSQSSEPLFIEGLYDPTNQMILVFIEAYNWDLQQWQFVNFAFNATGAPGRIDGFIGDSRPFVNDNDRNILIRYWTVGYGPIGGGGVGSNGSDEDYDMKWNYLYVFNAPSGN